MKKHWGRKMKLTKEDLINLVREVLKEKDEDEKETPESSAPPQGGGGGDDTTKKLKIDIPEDPFGDEDTGEDELKKESIKLKSLLEWNDTSHRNAPKRWSKSMNDSSGLTEFEETGGKDNVNEGPAGEYAKAYSAVKATYSDFWDAVGDFQLLLKQKGLRKHQLALKKEWLRVEKFYKFFFKMMDKLQ